MATNIIYESENNNSREYADVMTIDDIVYGRLSAANDVDCYKITFAGNGHVRFKLNIPDNADYRIRIYRDGNTGNNVDGENTTASVGGTKYADLNVVAGVLYYVIISVNTSGQYNANTYYNLQVIPTAVTSITPILSNTSITSDSSATISYVYSPSNAYVHIAEASYVLSSDCVERVGNTLYTVKTGTCTVQITDLCSNVSGNAIITSTLTDLHMISFNQKYSGNTADMRTYGCAICCAANLSSYYNNTDESVTLASLQEAGVYTPPNYNCIWERTPHFDIVRNSNYTYGITPANVTEVFNTIRAQINAGRPVLLHCNNNYVSEDGNSYGHWVVACKYKNNCSSYSDIYICDPACTVVGGIVSYSTNYPSSPYNNIITMEQARTKGSITNVDKYYLTVPE